MRRKKITKTGKSGNSFPLYLSLFCLSDSYCFGKDEWQYSIHCFTQLGHTDRNETDQEDKRSQCSVCHIDGNAGAVSYISYILHYDNSTGMI